MAFAPTQPPKRHHRPPGSLKVSTAHRSPVSKCTTYSPTSSPGGTRNFSRTCPPHWLMPSTVPSPMRVWSSDEKIVTEYPRATGPPSCTDCTPSRRLIVSGPPTRPEGVKKIPRVTNEAQISDATCRRGGCATCSNHARRPAHAGEGSGRMVARRARDGGQLTVRVAVESAVRGAAAGAVRARSHPLQIRNVGRGDWI